MPRTWLCPETGFSPDKGLRGAPRPPDGERELRGPSARSDRGSPNAGGGAEQRLGRAPSAARPGLPRPPFRPRPALLPGFSPASAEEVAEESVRTLGSLCERPRDTRQPLPSSDAAMGPAGAGASWREPRGIRASKAAKVTGEGAGGGAFLKSKTQKAGEREGAGGRRRGRFRAARQ